jgi:hypothetical protein
LLAAQKTLAQANERNHFLEQESKQCQSLLEKRQHDVDEWRLKATKWELEAFQLQKLIQELESKAQALEGELQI